MLLSTKQKYQCTSINWIDYQVTDNQFITIVSNMAKMWMLVQKKHKNLRI